MSFVQDTVAAGSTHRQTNVDIEADKHRQTDRQTDRQTERERERDDQ